MTERSTGWIVEVDVGPGVARGVFSEDRIANAYALSDLEPPYDRHTTVAVARRDGVAEAACLVVRHPDFTGIVTHGAADALPAMLAAIDLPAKPHIDAPDDHRPALERFYAFTAPRRWRLMAVDARSFRPVTSRPSGLVRLGAEDYRRLVDLYDGYEESAFHMAQLQCGVFYGVREGERLVAAGGTAGVAHESGIAVVVSVFTRPEARRRGLGAAVTSAISAELFDLGCRDVCLDVEVTNAAAVRLYERMGFRTHGLRWRGPAARRA